MPAKIYHCKKCNKEQLCFENEEYRLICKCITPSWHKLIPLPDVVHTTVRYMVEYYPDSINTRHEKTSCMIQDAADERELKQYQEALKNL